MKRRKEVEIMLTALSDYGIGKTPELKTAVEQGLKEIRKQKFQEKRWAKEQFGQRKMTDKKRRPG